MTENVSADFVFGTLATDDLRLAQMRAATAGVSHDLLLSPPDPRPGEGVTLHAALGPTESADHVTCYYTTDGSLPAGMHGVAINGSTLEMVRTGVQWDTLLWGYQEQWAVTIPPQLNGTLVRYVIEAWSSQNGESRLASQIAGVVAGVRPADVSDEDANLFALPGAQLWPLRRANGYGYHVDEEHVPQWLREAVIYHVFVDRFAPESGRAFATPENPGGFYGGTLRGVTEQIDYIRDLGASCIWLSPIFPSPSHHGYDATDYANVEPRLGSKADLRALVDAAHDRGIRVVLDYVANHLSSDHPAFQRAIADEQSDERGWFTFTRWPDQYLSFFGVPDLPQIETDNQAARDYLIENATYWLEFGVDGFRCDYANGPSHGFWSAFRAATRAAKSDCITLGEVVETAALQKTYAGRMDGCLDFLLLQALRQFFAFDSMTVTAFDSFLRRHLDFFPSDFVLPSFLDNHDMNRFLWLVGGDTKRLKLAALCQFTLPNPPIVYYGTEVGLSQARDVRYTDGSGHPEESRLPMLWGDGQDQELLQFYKNLVARRRATPTRWQGSRRTLRADDRSGLYVYRCEDETGSSLVILNNGPAETRYELPDGEWTLGLATSDIPAAKTIVLPPYAGALFQSFA